MDYRFDKEIFYKQAVKINSIFDDFMKEKGFSVWDHNDSALGYGAIASHKEDKFVPIFELKMWSYPRTFSIHVIDRNGNSILTGETAAIYSLDIKEDMKEDTMISKFKTLVNDVYDIYGNYCRENRLDFSFNNLEMERKEYSEIEKESSEIEI